MAGIGRTLAGPQPAAIGEVNIARAFRLVAMSEHA
jgi:hypothetical protein